MNISKSVLSDIRSLHQTKFRNETGLFIAEGEKVVDELKHSGLRIRLIAALPEYFNENPFNGTGTILYEVNEKDLARISLLSTPNKVLAVAEKPAVPEFRISGDSTPIVFLDSIRDPGNLGTIIRTAEWFGVKKLICSTDCVETFNPKVVQSAMGSLFRMSTYRGDLSGFVTVLKQGGDYQVYGADLSGEPLSKASSKDKIALIIGSESHGISQEILQIVDHKVLIAKGAGASTESLNAAVACGILLAQLTTN
jgi:TrmH family RNA methyltransferase